MSFQKWKKKKEKAIAEGNLEDIFVACSELAELYTSKEEFEDALKEYKEARRAAEALNDTIKVAVSHRMIGEVLSSMLNYDLAVKHQLKYLELAKAVGDPVEEQRALANLGHMYLLKADTFANPDSSDKQHSLERAKHYSSLSLQVCDKLTSISKKELTEMQARLYLNLGLTVEQQGQVEDAVGYFKKAINLCKSMDIWEILFRAYNSLACLYQHQEDYPRALELFDKAISVAQRLQNKNQHICDLLLLKADVLFDLPDFRGAKQCLLKAYKLNTENRNDVERKLRTVAAVSMFEEKLLNTPDGDLATKKALYESLGDGCASMRSFGKALEYYYLMLETAKNLGESGEQLKPCYVSLSQTYKDNQQYDLAIKYFKEELKLYTNNPLEACKTTLSLAETLEIKEADIETVLEAYYEARRLAQEAANHSLEARALSSIIQVLKDNNRISDARKLEIELENLKEKFGTLESSEESDDETIPDIGADICIDDLTDGEVEDSSDTMAARTRKKCPVTKFKRNEKGEFPLHTASINGNLALVKKLIEQGHPVNVRDHNGWLPLHEACNFGYLEIVQELLAHGAAINDKGTEGCDGMTPLLDAASNGCLGVMRLLLEHGASPLMRTNKGDTVLDCLMAWRKRYIRDEGRDLDHDTLDQYNDLIRTLRTALKKAGHKPESERKSPSPPPSIHPVSETRSARRHSGNEVTMGQTRRTSTSTTARRSVEDEHLSFRRNEQDLSHKSSNNSLRRSTSSVLSHQSTSATREYEETMKALRRKPLPLQSDSSPPSIDGRSALVNEGEIAEDWLVDDINTNTNRGTKRRRQYQFEGEPQRRPNRLISPETERRNSLRPVSPLQSTDSNDSDMPQTMDVMEPLEELSDLIDTTPAPAVPTIEPSVPAIAPLGPSGLQSSISSFLRPQDSSHPTPSHPISQPVFSQSVHHPSTTTSQMAPPSIKVRVEGKLLLIPLPVTSEESPTIAWLAEEAAKRYYSFEGVEPKLSLKTEDEAMLAPQDPVTLLLPYREVTGVVQSWKQHPITERYHDACSELGQSPDEYLERCLDVCQGSFSLNLKGCSVDASMAAPVFNVLVHHTSLQHLLLSNNRLGDAGVQTLAKLVVKLPHLRELDLTCNGITYEGLNVFVHQVVQHNACKRLETLKLSHNRLGGCMGPLSKLLQHSFTVTYLSISAIGLTSPHLRAVPSLSIGNLERLEAGHNALGSDGVTTLLRGLSVDRVVFLGLAHTGVGVPHAVTQWLDKGNPCNLRALDIAHCTDHENEFTRLIQCLEKAPSLEHLELTWPDEMDEVTLETLYRLPLKVLRLPGVSVSTFPSRPPPIHELSCLSLSSEAWAYHGPFGFFTNNPDPCTKPM